MMNQTVEKLVNIAFQDAGDSQEALEIKEAVMRDCQERFDEMLENGMDEDAAIAAVIESLQGMEEMVHTLSGDAQEETKTSSSTWTMDTMHPNVRLDLFATDVTIEPSHDGQWQVEFSDGDAERYTVEDQGEWTVIREKSGRKNHRGHEMRERFRNIRSLNDMREALVSLGDMISDELGNGTIHISVPDGKLASLKMSVTSGDIRLKHLMCDKLHLTGNSGDWEMQLMGDVLEATLQSTSGDIAWEGNARNLSVKTISGDVEVDGEIARCEMATVSGDIKLCLPGDAPHEISMKTTSGDMNLRLLQAEEVDLQMSSISGDRICKKTQNPNALTHVRAQSVSGDISIS